MNDVVERVARAIADQLGDGFDNAHRDKPHWVQTRGESGGRFRDVNEPRQNDYLDAAHAAIQELLDPGETWDGLPRQIMMWLDMHPHTPRALFKHLERCGEPVPQWLRDEPEMQALDHVPSKGTRCVIIYKAMISAALAEASLDGEK